MATPMNHEFCWNELATNDLTKAKDFYSKLLGWEFSEVPMGDMTYTLVKASGKDIAGIWHIPKDQAAHIPPHWMSYIAVKDCAASVKQAKQLGATIIKDTMTAGDAGRFAIMQDPTGAHIALWEPLNKK